MNNTIIAVYDSLEDAQNARQALIDSDLAIPTNVQLSSDISSPTATDTSSSQQEQSATSGIGHFFRSLFRMDDDEEHRNVYSEFVRRGSYILKATINSEQDVAQAVDVLNRFNPVDVDQRSQQWKAQGWRVFDANAPKMTQNEIEEERATYVRSQSDKAAAAFDETADETVIPVIQEELQIGKRVVQRGGIRIFRTVEETPVSESINLREEHVNVERRPVNKPASPEDIAAFKEGSIELNETAEEAVVSKIARVVEEVVVNKESVEHTEQIQDTVRHTDVRVEDNVGNPPPPSTRNPDERTAR